MNKFAGRLKLLRQENGLTQQDLADILGVKRTTVGMYETGNREPDFETMEKIADYFNVTMAYLLGESNEQKIPGYYLDEGVAKVAQDLYDNESMKLLFDAARGSKEEDLKMAADFLMRLKKQENNG